MQRHKGQIVGLALAALVALTPVVAGCGGDDSGSSETNASGGTSAAPAGTGGTGATDSTDTTDTAAATDSTGATETTASTGEDVRTGPPLVAGAPSGPITNNNNPFISTSAATILGYSKVIWEPLAQTNAVDPTAEPAPWLATEWAWSQDYTSVTFTMRDGVTWSDGQPATAADIAYTFNLFVTYPALNRDVLPITSAAASGSTATVTFASSQFVNRDKVLQTLIVPEHLWSTLADPSADTIGDPIGTGPFALDSWSQQAVVVKSNPNYWGGTPAVPEIRYVPYNDGPALVTALGTGEINWTGVFIPDPEGQYLSKDDNNRMWFPSGLAAHTLYFNTARPPFDNVALRQAVNMVIDRERIGEEAYAGLYTVITNPTGIVEPAGAAYIADEYQGQTYEVDVEGAKALLADAGYTLDDGKLHDPSGEQVKVTLIDPSAFDTMLTALQIISEALGEIGIDAEVTPLDANTWLSQMAIGDFEASINFTQVGSTPYNLYLSFMDGTGLKPLGEPATVNPGRFDNADAAAALQQYASAVDDATRTAALATLQDIEVSDVPAIPLLASPLGSEFSVEHYEGWPDADNPYANPQPNGPNAALILMRLKTVES